MDDGSEKRTSFVFSWGSISLEVGGEPELVKQGFDILQSEILPRIDQARGAEDATLLPEEEPLVDKEECTKPGGRKAPTPAEFIEEKQPKTNQERVTVLAYYAKIHRNAERVTVSEVEKLVNEAHIKMFKVQNAIWNSARTNVGWLKKVKGEKGAWKLTAAGENCAKTQLPRTK